MFDCFSIWVVENSCREVRLSRGGKERDSFWLAAFISFLQGGERRSVFKAKGFNLSKDREAIRFEDPMRREAPRPLQAILPANYKRLGKIQSQTRCLHPKNSISYIYVPTEQMSVGIIFRNRYHSNHNWYHPSIKRNFSRCHLQLDFL